MRSQRKFNKNKQWLIDNYSKTDKSIADIAGDIGCSYSTARKWIYKYGIKPKLRHRELLKHQIQYESGNKPWNKGLGIDDPRVKKAITKSVKSRLERGSNRGKKHYNWKGEDVGYKRLHIWVNKWKGKAIVCIKCGATKSVEWANISGKYKRELSDFMSLCKPCHMEYDKERR